MHQQPLQSTSLPIKKDREPIEGSCNAVYTNQAGQIRQVDKNKGCFSSAAKSLDEINQTK